MKIAVIGTGYVGLTTATCLAEIGHDVQAYDIDENKIKLLKKGQVPFYEPSLEDLVKRNLKEKRLSFTTNIKKTIEQNDIIFNAVSTPVDDNKNVSLKNIFEVIETISNYMNSYKVIVTKSTVPVGTNEQIKQIIAKNIKNKFSFDIVDNPEFLREGTAVNDFLYPDRIIIGTENEASAKIMEKIYKPILKNPKILIQTDVKTSELIKYAANAFLAMKISFVNEFANFCSLVGANIEDLTKSIGMDPRIGDKFLDSGIGYGGSCLPKDLKSIINSGAKHHFAFDILKAVEKVNENQKLIIVDKLIAKLPKLKNKVICIWGLAFKPKTDDMREAPSIVIIDKLLSLGAKIQAFDPIAELNAKRLIKNKNISFFGNAYESCKDADALILVTEWDEFYAVDFKKIKKLMKGNIVMDGRNIYDRKELTKEGFVYEGIGK